MINDMYKIITDYYKSIGGNKRWTLLLYLFSFICNILMIIIPFFAAQIIEDLTIKDASSAYFNIACLALSYIGYNVFHYFKYVGYSHCMKSTYKDVRKKITEKILTYDIGFANNISKGKILNTVNTDTARLGEINLSIVEFISLSLKVIAFVIIFLTIDLYIGIVIVLFMLIYLAIYNHCNVNEAKYLIAQNNSKDKLTENLSQIISGLGEIKMFSIESKVKSNFTVIANKWTKEYMNKRKYVNFSVGILPLFTHILKILLYLILGYYVLSGRYEISTLILLISYFESITTSSTQLMTYSREIRDWSVSLARVKAVLNYTGKEAFEFGDNTTDNIKGKLEFKNVSFKYKHNNKGKVKNISFVAKPGKITAFVGHSGSGKTTLTNLLLRKYKVDSGEILIDGINIKEYTKKIYSNNVVGVNQSPYLFNMSIKANLALIDKNPANQIEACKRVGIHDYIMSLPSGYNTVLSENASNFSGGQKQLLAIARVILSKAEILIFDEVTSSLDTIASNNIKEVLENLKLDHTIVLITHKKDVMKLADNIVVLNKGNLVGIGSHTKLMKENKTYMDIQTHEYTSISKLELEEDNVFEGISDNVIKSDI